jgi:sterol desaturase/sphingolipid hydroxylase (fatty acid hydroxylase superfamily)
LALIGVGLRDFFVIHIFTLAVGHYNHSNISISGQVTGGILGALIGAVIISTFSFSWIGMAGILLACTAFGILLLSPWMKYLFNSPEMHIWHHAYHLPADRQTGVNFGLTLSIWDWLFKTAYIPHDGRDIPLGFPGVEAFPKDFVGQSTHGFGKS